MPIIDGSFIYKITNLINGKPYVGQTTRSIEVRFREHANCKTSFIGKAIRKYGYENFKIEILEECDTLEQLNEREKFFIAAFNSMSPNGYNLTGGGEGKIIISETSTKLSQVVTKLWASRSREERSEMARKRESRKSVKARSESARKAAATRNKNPETHRKMSAAQRGNSPFKNLLKELYERELTYKNFGKAIGLSLVSISRKMRGKRNFTEKDIAKLVEIFGKPAEYLMARDD